MFDDETNITQNQSIYIESLSFESLYEAAFSKASGPLMRPLSMVSFALNYYINGLEAYAFKLTNLIVHLASAIILFFFLRLLLDLHAQRVEYPFSRTHRDWICIGVTSAWLLHPLNLSTVLYVVQRMNGLAAFFSLCTMLLYLCGRARQFQGKSGVLPTLSAMAVTLPLAVLSKENGVLTLLFLLVIEWTLLGFFAQRSRTQRWLKITYSCGIGITVLSVLAFLISHPDWLEQRYLIRNFTLQERLLTEARVIWFYLALILLPRPSSLGLYHDDIPLSHGLFDPMSTFASVLGIVLLLLGAILLRRKAPIIGFGLLFFLAGHSLESTLIPLEIAWEHRNYLPMIGVLFILIHYLGNIPAGIKTIALRRCAAVAFICALSFVTALRANDWSEPTKQLPVEVAYHPNSSRANLEAGRLFNYLHDKTDDPEQKKIFYQKSAFYYARSYELDEYQSNGLFALLWMDSQGGRRLNERWLAILSHRLATVPMSAGNILALQNLNTCQGRGDCPLPDEVVDRLIASAMRNPGLTDKYRAIFLSEALARTFNRGDLKSALSLSEKAVLSDPNTAQHWLNRIDVLLEAGQVDRAREAVERVSELYLDKKERADLRRLQQLLNNAVSDHRVSAG